MEKLYGRPNFRLLGKRLGVELGKFSLMIRNLTDEQLVNFEKEGTIELDGQTFNREEIGIIKEGE